MPIVHMAQTHQEATERGTNVHLYRDSNAHTTLFRYSDGTVSLNLNSQIPLEEQPKDGYQYSPVVWLYETHHGLCIHEREYNGYHDSDFFMVVWNPETKQPQSIEFATTRGWSYPCYASRPDATPEVLAAFEAYQQAQRDKGRKVAKGTTGQCIWVGKGNFGERVGLKTQAGDVFWTAISNVEVVL